LKNLMISVSGVRGIIGDGLTPNVAMQFAQAYGSEFGPGKIVVGRDSRLSGPMIQHAIWAGLMSVGCDIVDLDIATTPTTEIITEHSDHKGGIIITASHNPKEWNALKLLAPDGLFLDKGQGENILARIENKNFNFVNWDQLGTVTRYDEAAQEHIDRILALKEINSEKISQRKFKIVVDCCNGAGGVILPQLLSQLGCETIFINPEPNGLFPRNPEPIPENLSDLIKTVKENRADLGIAVDPDVDRLALVSEQGNPLGEEYTLALVTRYILAKKPGPVVVNASTTQAIDDIASQFGQKVTRTLVGEINVALKAREISAVISGEGNGGVMFPALHIGRDAPVGIALILQFLSEEKKPLSQIFRDLPQYSMIKDKVSLSFGTDAKAIVEKLRKQNQNETIDETDGLKFLYERSWVHIRASNTEPIIRVIAEAPDVKSAQKLVDTFKQKIMIANR
jgi:phosphomannomutase